VQHFYNTVQKHISEAHLLKNGFNPIKVCEIGVHTAGHTKLLLQNYPNIELVGIDPALSPQTQQLLTEYPNFSFHHDYSLKVLPDYTDFDVVLIDGDHNYYTVYNELECIRRTHEKWPLVILHDTHYPYGWQDFAYFPNTIPDGELNVPGRSGVRQAVEDWLKNNSTEDTRYKVTFYMVFPGLAVIEWYGDSI